MRAATGRFLKTKYTANSAATAQNDSLKIKVAGRLMKSVVMVTL
jgi:hypothetical protein